MSEPSAPLQRILFRLLLAFSLVALGAAQKSPTTTPAAKTQPRPQPVAGGAGRVTGVSLVAVNAPIMSPRVSCPIRLRFAGTITTDGPAVVNYTWVSFDGGTWPTGTLKFTAAGTQNVTRQWQLGAPGVNINGWLQLKVMSPKVAVSSKAPFILWCAEARRK